MKSPNKLATVFGGAGFIGRYVVKRLAAQGYLVRLAVRNVQAANSLRPMGSAGQIIPLYAPLHEEALVARATEGADIVINLTGILAERRKGDFFRVHSQGAGRIARLAASSTAAKFVHLSAIGADPASLSDYARSKAEGEAAVLAVFPRATVLRPSIVFGAEDQFFNRFAAMATISPILPVISGKTRFQPVYVGDVADAVLASLLHQNAAGRLYELGGPDIQSFKQLIEFMLKIIERKRIVWDMPLALANLQAACLERLPGKLLTRDQIKLLQCDNVVAQGSLTLADLAIAPTPMDLILPSYLARYCGSGHRAANDLKK
jgi:NADH dehydrogenase